jgi:hypothetical protein|tara:strand:+ start:9017 stop:9604 length:588 start_codon:yes stop_codon:yes gene_type:complete
MKQIVDDNSMLGMDGHVLIRDIDTGEVLLNKHNAINFYNMSIALSSLLAKKEDDALGAFNIATLELGNGGTTIDGSGNVFYKTPNVATTNSTLYAQTYSKNVVPAVADVQNKIDVTTHAGQVYSDTVVTATLLYAEPAAQGAIDNDNGAGSYVFDEMALQTASGKCLTHLIFHPIEKSANRQLEIIYTIRITAGA